MSASVRQASFGIMSIAAGLFWDAGEKVLMVWGYHDESGEYVDGKLVNMTVGGCYASLDKWQEFDRDWAKALEAEGLEWFHMTDFEAWVPPFNFQLPDGNRDYEKHKRILDALLNIMLRYVEGFYGFGAVSMFDPSRPTLDHERLLEDCACGAIKHAVLNAYDFFREPVNVVFGKQKHFTETKIRKYIDFYDYEGIKDRIGTFAMDDPRRVRPLQAADILAYEMSKAQREHRERYPYRRIMNGALALDRPISLNWGPLTFQWGR